MVINPQHVILFHYFRRFLERAAEARIDVAPLKGAHLITTVYSAEEDRGKLADVDFLVRPSDWQRTLFLLEEMEFARTKLSRRPVTDREFHEAQMFLEIPRGKIMFEPHRYLVQPARHNIDHAALWERSEESTFDGAPCLRLTPEDHLLHATIHLMSHGFVSPVRGLRDIELLIRAAHPDLDVVESRARKWECTRALYLVYALLDRTVADLGLAERAAALPVSGHIRLLLTRLVPNAEGFVFPNFGLRATEATLFPLLMDGTYPLIRFTSSFAMLRLRDYIETMLLENQ